ncbi:MULTISPECIES: TrlF family AAA-like ATPase [Acinetobacter]|nr:MULTISPECIES: hypothetical protein [Acinetobacter]MCG9243988.1 hypothetical protein [Acinetobacter baumannii]MCQ1099009.1 hypothetical protein [Acinetobacter baumannii]MDA3486696.1 hypothetical protein [Acinetobacter baumannii]MDA3512292.1 hypothetical protein [Acinetobacter baumannii]MDA3516019.1 hypothetical protein [Acinetobacter baumannii]
MNLLNIKNSQYPVGSEWRRWDLHVHTPESQLGSSFIGTTWDQYLDALEAKALEFDIAVIGITDYMTVDGYKKIYEAINNTSSPRLSSVKFILPNIEFRAQPSTKEGKALNIHLLINPTDSDHIDRIQRALQNLKISYDSTTYGCFKEDLIAFAKAQDPSIQDNRKAYKFGIEQFKPSYQDILKWISNDGWLKKNSLIGIANGKDGVSGLPIDGFSAVRDELLRQAHFIFSGNTSDRKYYLGQKQGTSIQDIMRMYKSLKPCLHGSDAHTIDKFFKPDDDKFCWIKADPSFEGLKQVLWEPDSRVKISNIRPQHSNLSKIITKIKIDNHNGWFSKETLNLNSGLISVIGEKGAGKTAIADLIAFAAGVPLDPKSQASFINKGKRHLSDIKIELTWGNGEVSTGILPNNPLSVPKPLVRYLSQDFVERLCSNDHQGDELQKAIEEVVFNHLEEDLKEDYSSFEELRSAREAASQSRQNEFRGQIIAINREIERLHSTVIQKTEKQATLESIKKQIIDFKSQLPALTQTADVAILKLLEKERYDLKEQELSLSKMNRSKRYIEELLKTYKDLKEKTDHQIDQLIAGTQEHEIIQSLNFKNLKPIWDPYIEFDLEQKSLEITEKIKQIKGSEDTHQPTGNTIFDIQKRILDCQQKLSNDEINRKRLLDLQKQISDIEQTEKRLKKEIKDIDQKILPSIYEHTTERHRIYLKHFEALAEDLNGLKELYSPMQKQLASLGTDMTFELSAGYKINHQEWVDKIVKFFDGRKPNALAKKEEIETFIVEKIIPAWETNDKNQISKILSDFYQKISPFEFMENCAAPSLKLIELFDWMFSTDHISTTYRIKYAGSYLEHLSPGTRGIALLVLYLLMDEDDRRPLIIDQPEGNLDNSSVYAQLVPYIRKAKENRQIIIVTHNPNLVVGTDAEQIIIAASSRSPSQVYPCITYYSGSLEHNEFDETHKGIRQTVCTLLEGGDKAFKDREGRYSII